MAGLATYTVILLDPKVSPKTADLFWVPEHDKRRGPNVITTLTAPHSFTARRLAELRGQHAGRDRGAAEPARRRAAGRPERRLSLYAAALAHLPSALQSLAALGCRADDHAVAAHAGRGRRLRARGDRGQPHLFWDGKGENPYPQFLAQADAFIVPADSVNMTGEPCATGKPIYVFEPEGGSAKFTRFHDTLRRHGATRPLPARFERLETWSYAPLNSAETIAAEIARRWAKRRQMLGTPAPARAREA